MHKHYRESALKERLNACLLPFIQSESTEGFAAKRRHRGTKGARFHTPHPESLRFIRHARLARLPPTAWHDMVTDKAHPLCLIKRSPLYDKAYTIIRQDVHHYIQGTLHYNTWNTPLEYRTYYIYILLRARKKNGWKDGDEDWCSGSFYLWMPTILAVNDCPFICGWQTS